MRVQIREIRRGLWFLAISFVSSALFLWLYCVALECSVFHQSCRLINSSFPSRLALSSFHSHMNGSVCLITLSVSQSVSQAFISHSLLYRNAINLHSTIRLSSHKLSPAQPNSSPSVLPISRMLSQVLLVS